MENHKIETQKIRIEQIKLQLKQAKMDLEYMEKINNEN